MNNYITSILEQMETVSRSWILTTSSTWVRLIFALFFNGGIINDKPNKDINKNSIIINNTPPPTPTKNAHCAQFQLIKKFWLPMRAIIIQAEF